MKVNCEKHALARLREFFHSQENFGKNWVKSTDTYISISSKQIYVRDQILVIEDGDKKEWMESLYDIKTFPFIYNGIADKNPNSSHNIEEFRPERFVAAKFSTHAINFRFKSKPDGTFNYNFRLLSVYLVDEGLQPTSMPTKRKRGPDKWAISSSKTRKTINRANLLRLSVPSPKQGK